MPDEWMTVELGAVTDQLTGFPFKSSQYVEDPSAVRLLRGDNIAQGFLRWDGVKRWPRDAVDDASPYSLEEGDVVLAMDRPWIDAGLKYATLRQSDLPALLVQRVARLRGTEQLETSFLKFVIGSKSFTDYVLAVQTGTAVPHISGGQIRAYEFALPPLPEQRAVSHILGTLDDKIALNRRMSATLEAIARALFRSWFVDFEPIKAKSEGLDPGRPPHLSALFPDRLIEAELGDIPEGWEVKPLSEVAEFLNGLALQKYPASDPADSLPVIKIAELRNGVTAKSDRASRDVPDKYIVKDGDFLFSWSGSLLAKFWTEGEGALNQHLFKVTSNRYPAWFYAEWVQVHLEEFKRIAAFKATTMGHIQRGHLQAAMTNCPPDDVLECLGQVISPLVQRAVQVELESRTLGAMRDTLLPQLMSGELRVKDAETFLDRVL